MFQIVCLEKDHVGHRIGNILFLSELSKSKQTISYMECL